MAKLVCESIIAFVAILCFERCWRISPFVCVAAKSLLYRARIPSGIITVNAVPTNNPAPRTVTSFSFCSDNLITSGILPAKYDPTNITTTNSNNTNVSSTIFVACAKIFLLNKNGIAWNICFYYFLFIWFPFHSLVRNQNVISSIQRDSVNDIVEFVCGYFTYSIFFWYLKAIICNTVAFTQQKYTHSGVVDDCVVWK